MQNTGYIKRQKELRRLEKQQQKQAKRAARAASKRQGTTDDTPTTLEPVAPRVDSATITADHTNEV